MKLEAGQHLKRSEELLEVARRLAGMGFAADSVGRSYYAMFHAATAILLERGIERASHKAVVAAFGEFLVKSGHMESRFHAYFRKAFEARNESDYLPVPSETIAHARELLAEAEEFVAAVRDLLAPTEP